MDDGEETARYALSTALGSEPPRGLDAAALIRRARKRTLVTRGSAVGGVALGAVAATTLLLGTVGGPGGAPSLAGAPGTGTPAPSPSVPVDPCAMAVVPASLFPTPISPGVQQEPPSPGAHSAALTAVLHSGRASFVPAGVVLCPTSLNSKDDPLLTREFSGTSDNNPPPGYTAQGNIPGGGSPLQGAYIIMISKSGRDGTCASLSKLGETYCHESTLGDGTKVATQRTLSTKPNSGQSTVEIRAWAKRADGGYVEAAAWRTVPVAEGEQAQPALTEASLLTLVTLPGLSY
ncbi:hypothetical protein AB0M43_24415 [Longispora sp. NPDC051575]|uniref:hypothetical protein n=1 Tax=Longispora sp. NPDC051575 TaxID=3154943 RepID=UPI00343CBBD2